MLKWEDSWNEQSGARTTHAERATLSRWLLGQNAEADTCFGNPKARLLEGDQTEEELARIRKADSLFIFDLHVDGVPQRFEGDRVRLLRRLNITNADTYVVDHFCTLFAMLESFLKWFLQC